MRLLHLTKEQKAAFTEHFYDMWPCEDNDLVDGDPYPWGLPWLWSGEDLEAETVEELAHKFFEQNKEELLYLISEFDA